MKKKIVSILLLALAVLAVVELKNRKGARAPEGDRALPVPSEKSRLNMVPAVSDATTSALPRLLDLGAGKCVPCKAMAPILDEMKEAYAGQLDVVFIDVWENEGAGEQYGVRIIPTQIFFDDEGNELFRHEGFFSREEILAKWAELGYEFK